MIEIKKELYKLDSKGKERILIISTDNGTLTQESGLLEGKRVIHSSVSKPKNVGKANETTSQQQAILEAESNIKKKLDEGYFESIEDAKTEKVILPMLAKSYDKEKKKIVFPCYVQPKLDGMRALGTTSKMISRKNKAIDTIEHIHKEVKTICEQYEHSPIILDGEIYAHGLSFQENMKLVKKYRKGETEKLVYHVYDIVMDNTFSVRNHILHQLASNNNHIALVPTFIVENEQDIIKYHKKFLSEGYEGTMVRWGNEEYKINGRSSNLLKFKDFIDIDAEILDIIPNNKSYEQGTPLLKYNNKEFKAGVKMSHEDRKELLFNKKKYIGKKANIRFFEWTDDLIPRFPIMIGIHEDR